MRPFLWMMAVCLTLQVIHGQEPVPKRVLSKHGLVETKIVGGDPVPDSSTKYSFIASLQKDGFGHYCGGSLISPTAVLTAAHCQSGSPDPSSIRIGAHRLSKSGGEIRGVKRVIIHPSYKKKKAFDMAIIILDTPVTNIEPVALSNGDSSFEAAGLNSKVIGWGLTKGGGNIPDRLQQVTVPIVSRDDCTAKGSYSPRDIVKENICAGFKNGGKDSCQGDSGGPLFVEDNTTVTQIGVVSWGGGCARPKKYGVYCRVSSYLDWIGSHVSDFPGSGPPVPSPTLQPSVPSTSPTPPPSAAPSVDWDLYFDEMAFCKKKGKNPRKCKRLSSRCQYDNSARQCVSLLVNNPDYQTPPSAHR